MRIFTNIKRDYNFQLFNIKNNSYFKYFKLLYNLKEIVNK